MWLVLLLSAFTAPPSFIDAQSVAVGPGGQILVVDAGTSRLTRLQPDGMPMDSTGGSGSRLNAMRHPRDVDAGHGLRILVADPENSRLVWLDRLLQAEADIPTGPHRIHRVAVDRFGDVFAIDADAGLLLKYRANGQPDASFPEIRLDPTVPTDVALAGDDVLVANGRVLRILNRFGAETGFRRFEADLRRIAAGGNGRVALIAGSDLLILDPRYREIVRMPAGPDLRDVALAADRLILLDGNGVRWRTLD